MIRGIITAGFLSILLLSIVISSFVRAGNSFISIKKVEVTSTLNSKGNKYSPSNLFDRTADSWCEGVKKDGIGEVINISFEKSYTINTIYIKNGYGIKKYFPLNNRVRSLSINGTPYKLTDDPEFQSIKLKKTLTTDKLVMKILSVFKGKKYPDTCVSEISFIDVSRISFNKKDGYRKITGKPWGTPVKLKMPGDFLEFTRDYLFTSETAACGDATCPQVYSGNCRQVKKNKYMCRFIDFCYGVTDSENPAASVGRECGKKDYEFVLEIINNIPHVTRKGKKAILKPF
ncbi:hypothetical protein ACFL20_02355 [Spirochaetota bacterium]